MKLTLTDIDGKDVVEVALLDVLPEPENPEEGYFTTLDIVPHNDESVDDWMNFFESLSVVDENGDLLSPDHGDIYLERLASVLGTGTYLVASLE